MACAIRRYALVKVRSSGDDLAGIKKRPCEAPGVKPASGKGCDESVCGPPPRSSRIREGSHTAWVPQRRFLLRKEVIQPQVLLRLPCYDFTPIMGHTLGTCLLAVGLVTSSTAHFRDVTGGVYKARERIHGVDLIRHY